MGVQIRNGHGKGASRHDELLQLDKYVEAIRANAQRALASLREDAKQSVNGDKSGAVAQLQAQVQKLQLENRELRASSVGSAAAPDSATVERLTARCKELERQVASATRASASGSARGATPLAGASAAAVGAIKEQLSQLRADKDEIEGKIVEMYECFFSDDLVKGVVSVLRKKEDALLMSQGSGSGNGEAPAGGKLAPRMKARLDAANAKVQELERELAMKESEMDANQRHHDDMLKVLKIESEAQISHFQERWAEEQVRRKRLHQKVLEMKGAIRVFCRVRPLMAHDGHTTACINIKDEENLVIQLPAGADLVESRSRAAHPRPASAPARRSSISSARPTKDDLSYREVGFEFDRVFGPFDDQEAVYEDVQDLVISVADGYNVCILAYGQTGSGKTYTMQGPPDKPGINTRALSELFKLSQTRSGEVAMHFQASIVEIYNENIYDLLADAPRESSPKLEIKEHNGHIWIPHLVLQKVACADDVERLIRSGDKNRSTFATDMNEHSSRSHLILSLYVRAENKVTGEKTASKLHLIDLAGSERISRSHAAGDRLKEVQSINSSLSSLGDVIQSLQQHREHIPYRNSKLTRLLSDSLGGASKTLLVCNLSPTRESAGESRCSCEFAIRAKKVELGQARKQLESSPGPPTSVRTRQAMASSPAPAINTRETINKPRSGHHLAADPAKLKSTPA